MFGNPTRIQFEQIRKMILKPLLFKWFGVGLITPGGLARAPDNVLGCEMVILCDGFFFVPKKWAREKHFSSKMSHFARTWKYFVLSSLPMDWSETLHAPRYTNYLWILSASSHLNLGIQSCDRKTIQEIRIVLLHSAGPNTRCGQ